MTGIKFDRPLDEVKSFVGAGEAMDPFDIPHLAYRISVGEDHLRAFLDVEAAGFGYDPQGRPKMLFEPHIFWRLLGPGDKRDEAASLGIAYPRWGTQKYPRDSYPRLVQAMRIDEDAALRSCSIGLSQVLVDNCELVGYDSPQEMWQDFMDREEAHVEAMVNYILATGIADDLAREDWASVARTYNGPGYARHNYHGRMAEAFAKHRRIPDLEVDLPTPAEEAEMVLPEPETIRSVQRRLRELGYHEAGKVDGNWGPRTRAGTLAFRADHGLPLVPWIDDELLSALMLAEPFVEAQPRRDLTVQDVRRSGSETVGRADKSEGAGFIGTVVGAIGTLWASIFGGEPPVEGGAISVIETARPVLDFLGDWSPAIMLVLFAYVMYQQQQIRRRRRDDESRGVHAGRV